MAESASMHNKTNSFLLTLRTTARVFRLNYMNIISNRAQSLNSRLWAESTDNLEKRIGNFILPHIERPSGRKILKIKMEELAQVVNDTRMGVSRALNSMQEKSCCFPILQHVKIFPCTTFPICSRKHSECPSRRICSKYAVKMPDGFCS